MSRRSRNNQVDVSPQMSSRPPLRISTTVTGLVAIAISAAVLSSVAGVSLPSRGIAVVVMLILGLAMVARGLSSVRTGRNQP